MKLKILSFLIFIITFSLAEEDVSEETTVNDYDKTSSRVNNMFESVETVQKAYNAVKTGKSVKEASKEIKNFDDVKALSIAKLKSSLSEKVFKYKNAKAGFLSQLFSFSAKLNEILGKVNTKLNTWNTTLPTIKAYGKTARIMLDNTVEVFSDFKWSDAYDIDRKWDKGLESQLWKDKSTFYQFSRYMEKRYDYVNNRKNTAKNFASLFTFDELTSTDSYEQEVLLNRSDFHAIPSVYLLNCAEAVSITNEILSQSHSLNDDGVTQQQAKFDEMSNKLCNGKRTMEDERQLQTFIERSRHEINVQTTQLEQLLSNMEQKYARLLMRNTEAKAMEYQSYYESIDKIIDPKHSFVSINDYREKLFK